MPKPVAVALVAVILPLVNLVGMARIHFEVVQYSGHFRRTEELWAACLPFAAAAYLLLLIRLVLFLPRLRTASPLRGWLTAGVLCLIGIAVTAGGSMIYEHLDGRMPRPSGLFF